MSVSFIWIQRHQCITVHQRTAHYLFVHYSALFLGIFFLHVSLWKFIFFHVVFFSCYTLFMLKCFHAAPFPYRFFCVVIFFMLHYFHIVLFPCCTLFILHNFHFYFFSCYTLFMLHFFHIALFSFVFFSCYTLFVYCTISYYTFTRCKVFVSHSPSMLHFVPIAIFPEVKCSKDSHKHIKWRALQQQLTKSLDIVPKLSILDVCWGPSCNSAVSLL